MVLVGCGAGEGWRAGGLLVEGWRLAVCLKSKRLVGAGGRLELLGWRIGDGEVGGEVVDTDVAGEAEELKELCVQWRGLQRACRGREGLG